MAKKLKDAPNLITSQTGRRSHDIGLIISVLIVLGLLLFLLSS